MDLVAAYASESESDSGSGGSIIDHDNRVSLETDQKKEYRNEILDPLKRTNKFKNIAPKKQKLQRKSKGPWGSWSSSSDGSDDENSFENIDRSKVSAGFNNTKEMIKDSSILGDQDDSDDIGNGYRNEDNINKNTETSTLFVTSLSSNSHKKGLLVPDSNIDEDLFKASMSFKCYLPKRILHTYTGHRGGCNAINFIPSTGHLFISGGNDDTIKIWNFYGDRKCVRDYRGHTKAIKTLTFVNDGSSFISSSFDQTVKVWDTERGSVTKRLKLGATPNAVASRPMGSGNEFIVGLSNSKIMHYDMRVQEKDGLVQQYDHHQASVLALRYFPDGSKFISSSEDKSVRIWNNQINIPIKQISDTTQHSMPTLDIHPSGNYFSTQSMDNSIYSYSMKPKYKRHTNKIFRGQKSSGYAIDLTFSPDGHYICSGDIRSKILIWDWTTTKLLKTIPVPGKKPITQVSWNPQATSKILCAGIDGKIYMLD